MKELVTRAYNRFQVNLPAGTITKFSKEERLLHEGGYYIALGRDHPNQSIYFPRFIQSGVRNGLLIEDEYWFTLEYLRYPTLSDLVLGKNDYSTWWDSVFRDLSRVLGEWDEVKDSQPGKHDYTRDMYIKKTESEYQKFKHGWSDKIGSLFDTPDIRVNHVRYQNFNVIWPTIRTYIEQNMLDYESVLIHGDCCFSNIMYREGIVRFIDPRGSFGKLGVYGDRRYDIAKLYHSVDGKYDLIINDRFSVGHDNTNVIIDFDYNVEIDRAKQEFEDHFFPKYNQTEIKILQGCIYIGMCARHFDSLERQIVMYATGVRLLNEAMEL